MKSCAIFINPFIDNDTKSRRVQQMNKFALNKDYTITRYIENHNFLHYFDNSPINLLIIYSFKSLSKDSTKALVLLKKLLSVNSLYLYVFKNNLYAKDADLHITHQFKIIMDVLKILSNIETKQHYCENNGFV